MLINDFEILLIFGVRGTAFLQFSPLQMLTSTGLSVAGGLCPAPAYIWGFVKIPCFRILFCCQRELGLTL